MASKREPALVEKPGLTKDNIVLFADAIFSIAITLLVLNIKLPDLPSNYDSGAFLRALGETYPGLLSFLISFFVIALYWIGFHRIMQHLRRFDRRMLWLTMAFLFLIALMAFPTAVLGNYGNDAGPSIFYQVTLSISSIVMFLMWKYASDGHRLIVEGLDPRIVGVNNVRVLIPAFVMLATIPVTLYSPLFAKICWLSMIPLSGMAKRFYGIEDAAFFV